MDFDLELLILLSRDNLKVGPVYIKLLSRVHFCRFRIRAMAGIMSVYISMICIYIQERPS